MSLVATLLACGGDAPDYVRVVVEGSSPDLSSGPVTLETAVFGGGHRLEHPFITELTTGVAGSAPDQTATDFNLVLDQDLDAVDLRVAIATPSTRWSGGLVLTPPLDGATRRVVLQPGERSLGTTRIGIAEPGDVARYRTGLATAWSSTEGVSLRIDGNPDQPLARAEALVEDRSALQVRIASPTPTGGAGPDRLAVVWRSGDGAGQLLLVDGNVKKGPFDLGPVTDLALTCPLSPAAAVVLRSGPAAALSFRDGDGVEVSRVHLADDARAIRGAFTVGLSTIVGLRRGDAWALLRVGSGAVLESRDIDELLALALSSSGGQVVTVERAAGSIEVRAYAIDDLVPLGSRALTREDRLPGGLFGSVDVAGCGVAWPERRGDGTGEVDLWVQDLTATGAPTGTARILTGGWRGSYLAPRLVCTPNGAFAIFANATELEVRDGTLALRRVPAPPP